MATAPASTSGPAQARDLQRRFELLQAGLDRINQGFTVFDADLRLVAWNQTFFEELEFPQELAKVGTPFEAFMRYNAARGEYGPGDVEELVARRVRAAAAFEPHRIERTRPNGQIIEVRGEPLPEKGFVTLYTDITQRKHYDQLITQQNVELEQRVRERTAELERSNARLREASSAIEQTQAALLQAQKMEAVGQLTAGLAHDFNNLLTIVVGNLAALRDRHAHLAGAMEFVDPALQAAHRGVELIKSLLAFSRQQTLEPRPVDVGRLVDSLARLLQHSLPENIRIVAPPCPRPLCVMADPNRLESAIINIAVNARDAMPQGGELRIDITREAVQPKRAREYDVEPGDYVKIEVADTGIGMDSTTRARSLEPFFSTKPFGLGSGLGLSMVYGFVKQLGGGIRILSEVGEGTAVTILLPHAAGAPPCAEREPPVEARTDLRKALVLLVEDEPQVRRIIRLQLMEMGYPVVEAASGTEAAQMIENVPDVGILVTDVVMPGSLDGRALAQLARRMRPELRVVLTSGYPADSSGRENGTEAGWPILAKPFTREGLAAAIAAA